MKHNGYQNLGTRFGEFPGNLGGFIVICLYLCIKFRENAIQVLWLTKCIGCEYNKDNQTFFAENDILVSCMKQFPYNCSNTVAFKADLFHNWKNDLKCSANVNWRCSNGVDYRDRIIGRFPRDVIENQSRWTWWGAGSRGFIILFISYKINLLIHFTHVDDSGKVNINQGSDRLEVEFHSKMKVPVFVLKIIDSMFCIKIDFELK